MHACMYDYVPTVCHWLIYVYSLKLYRTKLAYGTGRAVCVSERQRPRDPR